MTFLVARRTTYESLSESESKGLTRLQFLGNADRSAHGSTARKAEAADKLAWILHGSVEVPQPTASGSHSYAASPGFVTSYVADLEAGGTRIRELRRFTLEESDEYHADWTPDSQTSSVASNRGGHYALYKQSLERRITPEPIVAQRAGGLADYGHEPRWQVVHCLFGPYAQALQPERTCLSRLMRVPIAGGAPDLIL